MDFLVVADAYFDTQSILGQTASVIVVVVLLGGRIIIILLSGAISAYLSAFLATFH